MTLRPLCGLAFILATAAVLSTATAAAQEQSDKLGIGVIDVQRIVRESAAAKSMRPQLEKLKKAYEVEVKIQETALRKEDQELSRQRAILSPEAYTQRRKDLQRRANAAQKALQERKRSFDQAIAKSMGQVHQALREIAVDVAKERSLSLVFPRSAVFLMETRYDITAEALKRLNEKLPKVTIVLPEKK